jgi:hypothetical protein
VAIRIGETSVVPPRVADPLAMVEPSR